MEKSDSEITSENVSENNEKTQHKTILKNQRPKPNRKDSKNFITDLDKILNKMGYIKSRENSLDEVQSNTNKYKDFKSRLKNLYDKPLTIKKNIIEKVDNKIITIKENNDVCDVVKNKIKIISESKIKIKCNELENVGEVGENNDNLNTSLGMPSGDFSTRSDLSVDELEFNEMVENYTKVGKKVDFKLTSENINVSDGLLNWRHNVAACSCAENISFNGEDSLKDIHHKLKIIEENHKVSSVAIKIKTPNQNLNEEVNTKEKAKFCKTTPLILTRYGLESICRELEAHPKLESLSVEQVPLPEYCQVMLLPSLAVLKELRLIATRLGDPGLLRLSRFACRSPSLGLLDLSGNDAGPEGVRHLMAMGRRRTDLALASPQPLSKMRILLDDNPIGDEGLKELLNSVDQRVWLDSVDFTIPKSSYEEKLRGKRTEDIGKGRLEVRSEELTKNSEEGAAMVAL